jgi:predicted porin
MKNFASCAAAATACAFVSLPAHAVDVKAGDWDLSVGGYVNAYLTHATCKGDQGIDGLALATQALGCNGHEKSTVIGNGLLPNALVVGAKSRQAGFDIGATLMIGAAVATGSSIANNSEVDVRQGFFTIGRADLGTFKLGRDYGLFGHNAILSDMTLLGVGQPTAVVQRGRVSLGHIGAGYTYLGHYGMLTYKTPSMGGFTVEAGLLSPVDGAQAGSSSEPQVQAVAVYTFGAGKAWVAGKTQKFDDSAPGANDAFRMSGGEIGASVDLGGFGLLANVQSGKGIGVLSDGDAGAAKQTNWLLQGTYKVTGTTKLGLGYGENKLKDGSGSGLRRNSNLTGGVYHQLTPAVTLVGELSRTESRSFSGLKARQNGASIGGIIFF